MSKTNYGKAFEENIRDAFWRIEDVSVTRLLDPQAGYAGVRNVCDFIVYKYPTQFFIECKSCRGNTLSISSNDPKKMYGAITNRQWIGMLEQSAVRGVVAGVMVWFIDHDITAFIPIQKLEYYRTVKGCKSINVKMIDDDWTIIDGKKKRIMFDYDVNNFLQKFTKIC